MNKYKNLEEAGKLLTEKINQEQPFSYAKTISDLASILTKEQTEQFMDLAAKTEWHDRQYLMQSSMDITNAGGVEGLLKVANAKEEFGWSTYAFYLSAASIIRKIGIDGLKEVSKQAKKLGRNHGWTDNYNLLFQWCAGTEDLSLEYLEEKVQGFLEGGKRLGFCRGCADDYFSPKNRSTYNYGYGCPNMGR